MGSNGGGWAQRQALLSLPLGAPCHPYPAGSLRPPFQGTRQFLLLNMYCVWRCGRSSLWGSSRSWDRTLRSLPSGLTSFSLLSTAARGKLYKVTPPVGNPAADHPFL